MSYAEAHIAQEASRLERAEAFVDADRRPERWGGKDGKLLVPQANIDYEIATIDRFGWADYFVMAAEMVDAARKAGGRIGPGRGAVGASVVAYALGITNMNPIGIPNLLFERFLNANTHPSCTLILIDMDQIGFDAALAYLKERFGDVVRERKTHRLAPDCWTVGERSIGLTHLPQLDVISRTLGLIHETYGYAPDFDSMPYDSWNMLRLIRAGDTSGGILSLWRFLPRRGESSCIRSRSCFCCGSSLASHAMKLKSAASTSPR